MAIKKTSKPNKPESSKRALSLAEIWDNTDASEASNNIPAGEHEVRVNSIELKDDPKKGKAAIITYEAIDGDHEGKTLRQLYKLSDAAGGKGPGVAYLMRDLALLGYEDIDGKKLKKTLQEISDEQPMVIINAVENGQYTNAYLQGLPENVEKAGDDDDDDDEEKGSELEVGDKVTGEDDDGNDVTGMIKKINAKKGIATVEDDDEEEHTCDLEGLTKEEEEEEEEEEVKPKAKANGKKAVVVEEEEEESDEIEVGDSVTWEDEDGDEQSGTVKKIKGTKAIVEDDDEDEHTVKLGDLTKA